MDGRTAAGIGLGLLAAAGGRLVGAEPAAPAGAVVRLSLTDQAAEGGPAILLAGSTLEARISGEPGAPVTWALAYQQTVLAHGRVTLDRLGAGRVRLTAPDVRHRTTCELALEAAGGVRGKAIVYPASLLRHAARRVGDLDIAVIDGTGRTEQALAAEGIDHESLDGQIARDFTARRTVILAGFRRAEELSRISRGFRRRVEGGVSLVILNPPVGWAGWGINLARPEKPAEGAVRFARGIGRLVPAADLGSGPWEATLQTEGETRPLVWSESPRPGRGERERPAVRHALVTARRAAKGRVVVSALPQTRDPNTNAVGRGMLGELMLWLIERRAAQRPRHEETDHVQREPVEMGPRRLPGGSGGR